MFSEHGILILKRILNINLYCLKKVPDEREIRVHEKWHRTLWESFWTLRTFHGSENYPWKRTSQFFVARTVYESIIQSMYHRIDIKSIKAFSRLSCLCASFYQGIMPGISLRNLSEIRYQDNDWILEMSILITSITGLHYPWI